MLTLQERTASVWSCANPVCPSLLHGKPRVLMVGTLADGTSIECHCPRCGRWTMFTYEDGRVSAKLVAST